jgi:hypothetical protein
MASLCLRDIVQRIGAADDRVRSPSTIIWLAFSAPGDIEMAEYGEAGLVPAPRPWNLRRVSSFGWS